MRHDRENNSFGQEKGDPNAAREHSSRESGGSPEVAPSCIRAQIKDGLTEYGVPCLVKRCTIVSMGPNDSPIGACREVGAFLGKSIFSKTN